MKYRTKNYITLILSISISILFCLGIGYYQTRKIILDELRSKVISVAADAAITLNKADILKLQLSHNNNSPEYLQIQQQLRQIRDVNRRSDIYVKFIYLLNPLQDSQNSQYEYLVDAEETGSKDYSPIGQIAEEATTIKLKEHLSEIYSPEEFITDAWGTWLTAYAPVYSSDGKYLATVGVNLYANHVIARMHKLIDYGLISFLLTLAVTILFGWFLSKQQALALETLHDGVKKIGDGDLTTRIQINTKDEFSYLAGEINQMAIGLQQREKMQQNFARYVSKHVMDSIIKSGDDVTLSGEKRKITLLFSDIRQFTHISEQYTPEQVVRYLNEYFSAMVEIIFRNNGVLDKFIGDGMMVEFGVPLEDEEQELNAVRTAIEMVQGVEELTRKWRSEGKNVPEIKIGVGIHTGLAVIGNIGSEKRSEYTAIGDTVNSASRIEQLTKELHTPILFSEKTAMAVKGKMKIKFMGEQEIRGKADKIKLYTVEELS